MIGELFSSVTTWYLDHINYLSVTALMTIESSFVPFPSEIVVPPAAYKAAQGTLSILGVFCAGTAGSLIGSIINYFLAFSVGRTVLYRLADTRIAHFFLINKDALEKAERYFINHGSISTFIGRLIPAARQVISLPAGIAKMDFKKFLLYTALGSGIWNAVLCVLGYFLFSQKELLERYYGRLSIVFLLGGGAFFAYMVLNGLRSRKPSADKTSK